jgi:signal transduction histidine kinase
MASVESDTDAGSVPNLAHPTGAPNPSAVDEYSTVLERYLITHDEASLYQASVLSQRLIESGLGPDDIVALHFETVEQSMAAVPYRQRVHIVSDAYQFLLEVMIAYGVQYKQYMELRLAEVTRQAQVRAVVDEQRRQEALQATKEKTDLLAVVAHEMRSPLTAAKVGVEMAARSVSRGSMERVPTLLEEAQEAMERLSRLTGNLVESSRGTQPDLQVGPQDLVNLIAQACRWARAAAVSKGQTLEWEREPLRLLVRGDADALLSVLGNLLSNAVRYTTPGGHITVRHGLTERDGSHWGWVEIDDTGVGMTPDVVERMFEKFYRGPSAFQVGGQGLGLGLALVQQFVTAHQGHLEVQSAPGEGSTFRFLIPAAEVDDESESSAPATDS